MTSTETGFSGSLALNASRANQMASIATGAPSSNNTLVAKYIYDAWGNEASTSFDNLTVKNPLRYRGAEGYLHLYGPDACRGWSLYLAGARVYHTGVGRWLTGDPLPGNVGDPMSFNRYLYVNANPVDYSDPSGLARAKRDPCSLSVAEKYGLIAARAVGTDVGAAAIGWVGTGFAPGIGTFVGAGVGGAAGNVEATALFHDLTGGHDCYKAENINADLFEGSLGATLPFRPGLAGSTWRWAATWAARYVHLL